METLFTKEQEENIYKAFKSNTLAIKEFISDKYHSVTGFIGNIFDGIGNLKYYFKVIWNDRDWDHAYMLYILHKKLKRMEDFFYSNKPHIMKAKEVAHQIKKARVLLNRLIESDYTTNATVNFDKKYPNYHGNIKFEPADIPHFNKMVNYNSEQAKKEIRKLYKHSYYMEKQDWDLLWKTISKYSQGWWD